MTNLDRPNPWAAAMNDPAMQRLPSPGPHFDAAIAAAAEAWVETYGGDELEDYSTSGNRFLVGVSRCLRRRVAQHRRNWDESVWATVTWEEHPDAASMLAAEAVAIRDEDPLLNSAGAP